MSKNEVGQRNTCLSVVIFAIYPICRTPYLYIG